MPHYRSALILFFALTAQAAQAPLTAKQMVAVQKAVATDIDNLVADTVNEGENEAHIAEKNPATCREKLLPGRDTSLLFCNVRFRFRPYHGAWTMADCDLTYVFYSARKFPTIARANGPSFDQCLERLNEGE